jgi:hypothetical protein
MGLSQPEKLCKAQYEPGQAGTNAPSHGPKTRLAAVIVPSIHFKKFVFR